MRRRPEAARDHHLEAEYARKAKISRTRRRPQAARKAGPVIRIAARREYSVMPRLLEDQAAIGKPEGEAGEIRIVNITRHPVDSRLVGLR
jgi:hypothetical protein